MKQSGKVLTPRAYLEISAQMQLWLYVRNYDPAARSQQMMAFLASRDATESI